MIYTQHTFGDQNQSAAKQAVTGVASSCTVTSAAAHTIFACDMWQAHHHRYRVFKNRNMGLILYQVSRGGHLDPGGTLNQGCIEC